LDEPPVLASEGRSYQGIGNFLARLSTKLAAAGIRYMVVGSFASSFHGVPRSSQDLDLVIDGTVDVIDTGTGRSTGTVTMPSDLERRANAFWIQDLM
jgi:hypothetical protein